MGIRSMLRKVFGRDREESPATSSVVPPQTRETTSAGTAAEPAAVTVPEPARSTESSGTGDTSDAVARRAADDLVAASFDNPQIPRARAKTPSATPEPVAAAETPAATGTNTPEPAGADAPPATGETARTEAARPAPADTAEVAAGDETTAEALVDTVEVPAGDETTADAPVEAAAAENETDTVEAVATTGADTAAADARGDAAGDDTAADAEATPVAETEPEAAVVAEETEQAAEEPKATPVEAVAADAAPVEEPEAEAEVVEEPQAEAADAVAPAEVVESEPAAEPVEEPEAEQAAPAEAVAADSAPVEEPEAETAEEPQAETADVVEPVEVQVVEPEPVAAPQPAPAEPVAAPQPALAEPVAAPQAPVPAHLADAHAAAAVQLGAQGLAGARAAVYLVVDRSGSMRGYFKDGSVQRLAEQVTALAAHLDEDATVTTVFFSTDIDGTVDLTPAALTPTRIDEVNATLGRLGRTNYHRAVEEVLAHHEKADPSRTALVVFQTDGAPESKTAAAQALAEAAERPLHWRFVVWGEEGNKAFDFVRKLDGTPRTGTYFAGTDPSGTAHAAFYGGLLAGLEL
ncbi:VWA domain-containing protein [Streptomyces sp. NPDC047972]|uniref:VWA domain-containing protein n=1 Tax=Streptomyces sp. NPDC047972 TaxID=3365493 RepID=UPI003721F37B